jgi:hypothetical protein
MQRRQGRNRCNRADWRRLSGTTLQAASRSRDPEVGERRLLPWGICDLVSFIQRLLILTNGNVAALPKILKYPK